jgi:hypothetical protein
MTDVYPGKASTNPSCCITLESELLTTLLPLLSSPLLSSSANATTLATEDFGDIQTSGCTSQWTGDCEKSTVAFGPSNTTSLAYDSGTSNYGVVVVGNTGVWPNGVKKVYSGSIPTHAKLTVTGHAFAKAQVAPRLVFRNSSFVELDSALVGVTVDADHNFSASVGTVVPSGTAYIEFQVGVRGASAPDVWIDKLVLTDDDTEVQETPTNESECISLVASECSGLSCNAICGSAFCSNCTSPSATCVALWKDGVCYVNPYCSCPDLNAVTPVLI